MRRRRSLERVFFAALLSLASASCRAEDAAPAAEAAQRPALGLMGTIPLYWGEQAAFGDALAGRGTAHWARAQLEARYALHPLDTLNEGQLADLDRVLLAQPRALSGPENVALDAWVRGGGRLLLFADPLLTGESQFPLGDRRRPQDVILLSPILSHWGLRLEFDEDQPAGFALLPGTPALPVNLPGRLSAEGGCEVESRGVIARCALGQGRVIVVADAALLDLHDPHPASSAALDGLLERAFGDGNLRETAGAR